jgi:hypothetical protein
MFLSGQIRHGSSNRSLYILQCAYENIRRAYRHKQIVIFSDSQTAFKALSSPKMTLRLVAECLDALSVLANWNEVTLLWVPGHSVIPGNEKVKELARRAAAISLLGPELALAIPRCSAREAIRNSTKVQHYIAWKNLQGHRRGKLLISGPCKKRD